MWLGQKVVFKGSGVLDYYLSFGRDEEDGSCLSSGVTFWRERVTLLNPLWTSLGAIQPPLRDFHNDKFSLTGSQPSNDWASCEKALKALICGWIELWQKLGGLPKYLLAQGPPV